MAKKKKLDSSDKRILTVMMALPVLLFLGISLSTFRNGSWIWGIIWLLFGLFFVNKIVIIWTKAGLDTSSKNAKPTGSQQGMKVFAIVFAIGIILYSAGVGPGVIFAILIASLVGVISYRSVKNKKK